MWIELLTLFIATLPAVQQSPALDVPSDISFVAKTDGTKQHYVLMLPAAFDPTTKHDLMIALHGHGSDRWQFAKADRDECRACREMAARHQMIFVCPEYRDRTSWMSPDATADMLQLLDDLKRRYRIGRVLLCGGSMGGTSALAFATMHPDQVNGVVSLNGTANLLEYAGFTEAIQQAYRANKQDKPELFRERSAELFPERLTFPVAATTGGRDELVPPDSTLRLMEKLKRQNSPSLSIHRPEGGHSTTLDDAKEAIQFVLSKWTDR